MSHQYGQLEEFKAEYRARFPGRDAETLTDQDLMREVMRHSDIRTTMDYYATVDAAVEEAVFGPKPNSLLNRGKSEAVNQRAGRDANTEGEGRSDAKR